MSASTKIFIAAILIILIGGGAAFYYFFLRGWIEEGSTPPAESTSLIDMTAVDEVVRVYATLKGLSSIDTAFLDGAVFGSLVDFTREIPELPKGRENPFAPIGNVFIKEGAGGKTPAGSPGGGGVPNTFVIP